jgi:hypothetical protein
VIDRLRAFLNRPLGDSDRRHLFIAAIAVIVAGAGALALIGRPASRTRSHVQPPEKIAPTSAPGVPESDLQPPSEEGRQPADLQASASDVRDAKRAARRFLAGYLPYTYGQRDARRIAAASIRLRRRLLAQPPRVPSRERRRHPRVTLLQADGISPILATATALVDDGARRYTVPLQLARRRSGWTVTDVGG